ncbi:MAG: hypothetical protein ACFCAD_10080 [Pleurocapsa sp.]
MTELTQDLSLAQTFSLIDSYAFDLGGDDAKQLIESWLDTHHASWIRLATIEALYLGRYKAISIEHILSVWSRIGTPNTHFTYEFERLICRKLPKHLNDLSNLTADESQNIITTSKNTSKSNFGYLSTQEMAKVESSPHAVNHDETLNLEKAFHQPKSNGHNIPIISALRFPYQTDWSEFTVGHTMIHQFIPIPDVSSFFNKLKTFGEEKLERQ